MNETIERLALADALRDSLDKHGNLILPRDLAEKIIAHLHIKTERDEAVKLLQESLLYSATGSCGPFKSRVREFLERTKRGA